MEKAKESGNVHYTLEDAVSEKSLTKVKNYIFQFINIFKNLFLSFQYQQLKDVISAEERLTEWLFDKKAQEDSLDYWIGYYSGILSVYQLYLAEHYKQAVVSEKLNSTFAETVPHFDEAISFIYKNEGVRHGKLAEALNIEKSTLSGIMDRIVEAGAATFSRPGKFKYYYLTPAGKAYYLNSRQRMEMASDCQTLTAQLSSLMSKSSDPAALVGDIVRSLFENQMEAIQKEKTSLSEWDRLSEIQRLMNQKTFKMQLQSSNDLSIPTATVFQINRTLLTCGASDKDGTLVCNASSIKDMLFSNSTCVGGRKYA